MRCRAHEIECPPIFPLIEAVAEGMSLGEQILDANHDLLSDPERADHFRDTLMINFDAGVSMLADLNIVVEDQADWVMQYANLAGDIVRSAQERKLDPLHLLRAPELTPKIMDDAIAGHFLMAKVRQTLFTYCRNQLFAIRKLHAELGDEFCSFSIAQQFNLSLEEEDVLAFLLYHSLQRGISPEGRDILNFLARESNDLLRRAPIIQSGILVEADLIRRKMMPPGRGNILSDDFEITDFGLSAWAGLGESDDASLFTRNSEDSFDGPNAKPPSDSAGKSKLGAVTKPEVSLDDVILPEDTKDEIKAALMCVDQGEQAGGMLGNALYGRGRACTILLHGDPGTGKTLTAQAIAHSLDRPLLTADWSSMGSALWWETENRLGAIFKEAEDRNAVLLLDEIDMLNKRSNETHSGQQHINRLVNVLLVKLENAPSGAVIILCTNRVTNIDSAIDRRLTLKLEIGPAETEEQKSKLWNAHLKSIPLDCELTEACSYLSLNFPMLDHGGHIKQVIMSAVRKSLVAGNTESLTLNTLEESAQQVIAQLDLKPKTRMGFGA